MQSQAHKLTSQENCISLSPADYYWNKNGHTICGNLLENMIGSQARGTWFSRGEQCLKADFLRFLTHFQGINSINNI